MMKFEQFYNSHASNISYIFSQLHNYTKQYWPNIIVHQQRFYQTKKSLSQIKVFFASGNNYDLSNVSNDAIIFIFRIFNTKDIYYYESPYDF